MIRLSKSIVSSQWLVASATGRVLETTDYRLLTTNLSIV